jgi:dephospho-CoA kinase
MPLKLFGLTGGIGMGKSTAAELLEREGIPVSDTDRIARDVVEPGQPALEEVARAFGPSVIGPDGRLRRDVMGQIVFADPAARQKLESILHPRIRQAWLAQVEQWRRESRRVGVVVIPLLFETQAEALVDAAVCVACSTATQKERLRPRGWDDVEIERRNQAQWPVEKKIALANYVVWTEGTLEIHAAQLRRIFRVG